MKIYQFASAAPNRLFAFTGDRAGSLLPERHGPWKCIGDFGPRQKIPHQLNRERIERSVYDHGYQMWRMTTAS